MFSLLLGTQALRHQPGQSIVLRVLGGENSLWELAGDLRSPALQRLRRVCGFNVALVVFPSERPTSFILKENE